MIQNLILKILEKSKPIIGGFTDLATSEAFVKNIEQKIKTTPFFDRLDKTISFFSGDLVEQKIQKLRPEAFLRVKNILNAPRESQSYAFIRLNRLIGDATEEEIKQASRINILQDAIREILLGKKHFLLEEKINGRQRTLQDILDEYYKLLDESTPYTKKILRGIKFTSDEIVHDKWFNFEESGGIDKIIENMLAGVSDESKKILDDVLKRTSEKIGVDYSIWNLYYPHFHINKWLDYQNKKILNTFYPGMIKDRKAFFEKPRGKTGSIIPIIDDAPLIWRTLFYQAEYMRRYREAITGLLWDTDLISKMTVNEIKEADVVNFLKNNSFDLGTVIKKEELPKSIANKLLPEEEGAFFWDVSTLLPSSKASRSSVEDFLLNIIEYAGGKPIEGRGNRRIYLIPSSLKDVFRKLEQYISSDSFLRDRISFMTHFVDLWKKMATAWGRFVPFRLMNSIGDFFSLAMLQPSAIKRIGDAIEIAYSVIKLKEIPKKTFTSLMDNKDLVLKLQESGAFQTILREFGGSVFNPVLELEMKKNHLIGDALINGIENGNIFSKVFGEGGAIEKISAIFESVPKIASVLDNLDRVERGLYPDFTGASTYIKSLSKKDKYLMTAIFERGADITVDYSAIPPRFRSLFSSMLFPFAFWYVRTFSKMVRMLGSKDGLKRWGIFYGLPLLMTYLWNTGTPERKAVWDGLPPYLKWTPLTVIAGIDEEEKKPIVFSIYTPQHMVADILGFDRILDTIERVREGELSSIDAASTVVFGIPADIPKKLVTFFNPIAQGIIGAATNKDIFTGRQIVKEELADTPEGMRKRTMYFAMNALMSPVIPMMMAGGYRDFDKLLNEIYGSNDKYEELAKFLKQFAINWVDVRRGFGYVDMSDIDYGTYVYRDVLNYYNDLLKQRDSFMEKAYRAYIRGDIEEFNRRREEAYSGKLQFINGHYFDHYFEIPSVIRRLKKDLIKKETGLSDEEIRRLNSLNDLERINEIINKEVDRWLRPSVRNYYQEIMSALDN